MPPERRAARAPLISLRGLQLHRGERHVLRGIDWTLRPDERWVVLGANGAGKTQLLKLICGAVWPDPAPSATRRYRVGRVWHDTPYELLDAFAYVGPERQDRYHRHGFNFTVQTVVATGCMRSDIPTRASRPAERTRVHRLLRGFGLESLARRRFLTLSHGERRLVLLARAIASRPRWLLLDELFAGLDEARRQRVLAWLEGGSGQRLSWVLTTHRLEDVPSSATHLLSLAGGRIEARSRWREPQRRATVSREPRAAPKSRPAVTVARRRARVLVACQRASVFVDWRPVLHSLSFEVRAGECWVLHGPNGSGKTTLLRALYGDYPAATGGHIRRWGVEPGVPLERFQRRCGWVSPHLHAVHPPGQSLRDLVVSGIRACVGLDHAATKSEHARSLTALQAFGLADRAMDPFATLSYGQARRALLARAAAPRPRLLLLDEPLAGLDVDTRAQILADVDRIVATGVAVVMSTHHRDEWPARTDHELELAAGRAAYAGQVRGVRA